MNNKTWRDKKIDYIEYFYKRNYDLYSTVDKYDDRRLYRNIYDQIIEAIESIPENPVPFVAVAMNDHVSHDLETLDDINNRFKGRETE